MSTADALVARTGERPRWLRIILFALDVAVPIAMFYLLRAVGVSAYLSLLAGAAASLVSAAITLVRDRRMNGVAAYMTTMLVLSTLVSLVAGSPRFLLARDAWLTHMREAVDSLGLPPLQHGLLWDYLERAAHSLLNSFDDAPPAHR